MKFFIVLISLLFGLSACSLNKLFLFPTKLDENSSQTYFIDTYSKDTIILNFGANSTPTFTNLKKDTLLQNFTAKNLYVKKNEGDSLNAWFFVPKTNYNGTTLCFLHGNGGNISSYFTLAKPFIDKGFKIFLFDYSGYGYSSGKSSRENVLSDANFALNFLKSMLKKEERLIIYGQSLGGHLAVTVAAKNEAIIDALVIEGAFSSHKNIAAVRVPVLGRIFVAEKYSALKAITQFNKPILIIHSTEDKIIPYSMSTQLYEKANEPKFLYTIDKDHILGPLYYPDSIISKVNNLTQ
jgi:uncharacterized protein